MMVRIWYIRGHTLKLPWDSDKIMFSAKFYFLYVRLHSAQQLWVHYLLSSICIYLALSWLNEGGLKWKCVFFGPKLSRDEKGFVRSVYFSDYRFPFNMQIS